ncbi:MAG: hypothetical protein KHW62_01330 [Clostridiales bacterium]|nr:hypothetical protein [Clostridiales bacterium]
MKNMKKMSAILLISICIVAVIICVIVTIVLNNDSRELEKESEKLNTLVAETSDGERIETEYTRIDDDKFFFKVPVNFVRWDDETIMKKYSGNVPDIVFSNEETTVNLILSFTEDIIANDQIEVYKNSAEITFTEIGEIIESDCYEVDGHNVGRIKVITPAADTDIYNDMIFFSYDDELIVLSFNCISELSEKWRSVGDFLIDSLFFTDNEQE